VNLKKNFGWYSHFLNTKYKSYLFILKFIHPCISFYGKKSSKIALNLSLHQCLHTSHLTCLKNLKILLKKDEMQKISIFQTPRIKISSNLSRILQLAVIWEKVLRHGVASLSISTSFPQLIRTMEFYHC
jgi:hypothetical protein